VFVTISSQRPNDISPTITSQAHNYFIHRLLNERDLKAIAGAVSYIDRCDGRVYTGSADRDVYI
jgi:DNA helicase HerA-like ATPase